MADVVANKKDNLIYQLESARLSSAVLVQLKYLKKNPTVASLSIFENNITQLLNTSASKVATSAFLDGVKHINYSPNTGVKVLLQREMQGRAIQAAKWITDTTGAALEIKAAMSKKQAVSSGRADKIAVHELSLAFNTGIWRGWGLSKTARKSWLVSDAHDRDDICDDNEDEGYIPINAAFQSGHFIPPAHLHCECLLGLIR